MFKVNGRMLVLTFYNETAMIESQFWALITRTSADQSQSAFISQLTEQLQQLDDAELIAFDKFFSQQLRLSYRWDVWGAAYIIAGIDSDYDFVEFRNFLITLGKETYQSVCQDPDLLGNIDVWPLENGFAYPFVEDIDLLAGQLYENRTGKELPFVAAGISKPQGKRFNDQPRMLRKQYPLLAARFPF